MQHTTVSDNRLQMAVRRLLSRVGADVAVAVPPQRAQLKRWKILLHMAWWQQE